MRLSEILRADRVGRVVDIQEKAQVLDALASLLSKGATLPQKSAIRAVLEERERLHSTGIGDGVAIPHGFLPDLTTQVAALLVCPRGIEFESIDHKPAYIILGVIGPKKGMQSQVEHLRVLARISKLLREHSLREKMLQAASDEALYLLIEEADTRMP